MNPQQNAINELEHAIDALQEARDKVMQAKTAALMGAGYALNRQAVYAGDSLHEALYAIQSASLILSSVAKHGTEIMQQRRENWPVVEIPEYLKRQAN